MYRINYTHKQLIQIIYTSLIFVINNYVCLNKNDVYTYKVMTKNM